MAPAHHKPKQIGNAQHLLDSHEATANSLHTADGNSPQLPCASLYKQASTAQPVPPRHGQEA